MINLLLILIFLPIQVFGVNCPDGYTLLTINGKCIKIVTNLATHADASGYCDSLGHLISIPTAIDNNAITKLAVSYSSQPFWIGLKCLQSKTPASCYWDDNSGSAQKYNAFRGGQPNVEQQNDECVYLISTGDWLSGDCNTIKLNFICEAPPVQDSCEFQHNGYCYLPNKQPLTEQDAQTECLKECGNLVSIHSPDENDFIVGTTRAALHSNFVRIGAISSAQDVPYWVDGSNWDYKNIGDESPNFGNCWDMELSDAAMTPGQWMNSDCSEPTPFICKRKAGVQCATDAPPSTLAPSQCGPGAVPFHNHGTFYSPNYPNTYIGEQNPCKYLMDTPSGTVAQIRFPILNVDSRSSIQLFSHIYDNYPFATVTSGYSISQWFNSTTNVIKMVFQPCASDVCMNYQNIYKWEAEFQTLLPVTPAPPNIVTPDPRTSGCNSTIPSIGQFTSPKYPQNYPDSTDCWYTLTTTPGKQILLTFDDVVLFPDQDDIVVRDGAYISSNVLSPIINNNTAYIPNYKSTGSVMLVSFHSDEEDNAKGFSASFTSF